MEHDTWLEAMEALPPERVMLAYMRSLKTLDIEYTLDGSLVLIDEAYNIEELWEDDDFKEEFAKQLSYMITDDTIRDLAGRGLVYIIINEDGEEIVNLTEEGHKFFEDMENV